LPKTERWTQILVECKDNVKKDTKPLLGQIGRTQRDLGTGAGGDAIKSVDLAAENAIIRTLQRNESSFTVISEESGVVEYGGNPDKCYITMDPIDGTTNLMRGVPFYATSIAVSSKPELSAVHTALVTDLCHDLTYTARAGKGAFLQNRKIRPSETLGVEDGVIGVDLNGYRIQELAPRLSSLLGQTKHMRHLGANALELCYVADGTIDAFVDIRGRLRTTDMAAAWLILREAGATITTPKGDELEVGLDPRQRVDCIAAANGNIHERILELVRPGKEAE
jgi:myo-inositol-1(or 4)-monophosphatase